MARDIDKRLDHLRSRRVGTDRLQRLAADAQLEILAKGALQESWQNRATGKPYTRYALGAMQEVGAEYTRISLETAARVGGRLDEGLTALDMVVEFRIQGSVALNVHIRGVSDVDLLILDKNYLTYATAGSRSLAGLYGSPTSRTSVDVLTGLRRESAAILTRRYPAATVDSSGSKAIKIWGGSLPRAVDVVPAHWHDNIEYQRISREYDRGVTILDSKNRRTIDNLPFLHTKRIGDRDDEVNGSLRKAIRLCKQVKADAEEDGTAVTLPSFDIAATMYHANMAALKWGNIYDLAVLAETQRHLDWLYHNRSQAEQLKVPDGSRVIFDSDVKLAGLTRLSVEIDDLLQEVAREQGNLSSTVDRATSRGLVENVYIPGA
jgi:hypothetical protein